MAGWEGMAGGRRTRWQLLGVVVQEGQMAGVVWQEADGREPDGIGVVGQGGPDDWGGGNGRVHEGQMAVSGGSGVPWSRSSRWWIGRGQIRGKGQ